MTTCDSQEIFAKRWQSSALTGSSDISRSTDNSSFSLTLNFGFGEDFHGFQATLNLTKIANKDSKNSIDASSNSLLIDSYYTDTDLFLSLLWQWLTQTLSRSSSMQQWL